MIGDGYWSVGITFQEHAPGEWSVSLQFVDNGFCQGDSSEGELRIRYIVSDLGHALATLKKDAERLGITWIRPTVYTEQDGEFPESDPPDRPDLRRLANLHAELLGWKPIYSRELAGSAA